jgi:hypothetical protein
METKQQNFDSFDENQSLQVIKEMIQVSQKKLKNDGILFILWGWVSFLTCSLEFVLQSVAHTYQITLFKGYTTIVLAVFALGFSIFYIYRKNRKAATYIGISQRYLWISMFVGMVIINLIQGNVLHKITFELQLPVFMVLVANALVVTGGMLRYKMVVAGGIIFGLLAYLASFFSLNQQFMIEAIAWVIGFIIPGHILYAKRNS